MCCSWAGLADMGGFSAEVINTFNLLFYSNLCMDPPPLVTFTEPVYDNTLILLSTTIWFCAYYNLFISLPS